MSKNFLHGIEIEEIDVGPRIIGTVNPSVIGLLYKNDKTGTSPILLNGSRDITKLIGVADEVTSHLNAIFAQTECQVVMIPCNKEKVETNEVVNAFTNVESIVGQVPRILIAPGLQDQSIIEGLATAAERLRAIAIVDGSKEVEKQYNYRLYVVYPKVKVKSKAGEEEKPASPYVAGAIVRSDQERGYWFSPSNQIINGIIGTAQPISFALGDSLAMANILNGQNKATIIYQNGYRLWGNRTRYASSHSEYSKWKFINVRRTADIINDSLLRAHFWAIDRNITKTYISEVTEGVNIFLRNLKSKGAIIGGKCWADPERNTPEEIQEGRIAFNFDFTAPYPAERITFTSALVNNYLKELFV